MKIIIKEIVVAVAAFLIAVGIIYVVREELTHILGGTGSDREVVLALEVAAVAILFGLIVQKHMLHTFEHLFKVIKGKTAKQPTSGMSILEIYVVVIISLVVYIGMVKYALPPS